MSGWFNLFYFGIIVLILSLAMTVFLTPYFPNVNYLIYAFIVIFFLVSLITRLSPRFSIAAGILLLVSCLFLLILNTDSVGQIATYAYLWLVIGVLLQVIKHLTAEHEHEHIIETLPAETGETRAVTQIVPLITDGGTGKEEESPNQIKMRIRKEMLEKIQKKQEQLMSTPEASSSAQEAPSTGETLPVEPKKPGFFESIRLWQQERKQKAEEERKRKEEEMKIEIERLQIEAEAQMKKAERSRRIEERRKLKMEIKRKLLEDKLRKEVEKELAEEEKARKEIERKEKIRQRIERLRLQREEARRKAEEERLRSIEETKQRQEEMKRRREEERLRKEEEKRFWEEERARMKEEVKKKLIEEKARKEEEKRVKEEERLRKIEEKNKIKTQKYIESLGSRKKDNSQKDNSQAQEKQEAPKIEKKEKNVEPSNQIGWIWKESKEGGYQETLTGTNYSLTDEEMRQRIAETRKRVEEEVKKKKETEENRKKEIQQSQKRDLASMLASKKKEKKKDEKKKSEEEKKKDTYGDLIFKSWPGDGKVEDIHIGED